MLITMEEYRAMLGLEDVNEEQAEAAIRAAEELIGKYLRRRLALDEYTEERYFDAPRGGMQLRAYPVEEILEIEGAQVKHLDAENGILRFERPAAGAVRCRYRGGMDEIPMAIRQACALMAQALTESAGNGGRALMSERLGDYQVMFYNNQESRTASAEGLSPAAAALLAPYRSINR